MPQPNKGPRDTMTVRPDAAIGTEIRRRARSRGLSVSDYVSGVLAVHIDRPELAPPTRQEELPLTG